MRAIAIMDVRIVISSRSTPDCCSQDDQEIYDEEEQKLKKPT